MSKRLFESDYKMNLPDDIRNNWVERIAKCDIPIGGIIHHNLTHLKRVEENEYHFSVSLESSNFMFGNKNTGPFPIRGLYHLECLILHCEKKE